MIPTEFVTYLYHFHVDRDYFECHEVLEEYWKENTSQEKDSIWVGFILLAVANYHHRRNNFKGAIRTLEKANLILSKKEMEITHLGIDEVQLLQLLNDQLVKLKRMEPYKSYLLPIINKDLHSQCLAICKEPDDWGKESNLLNEHLIHRHKLRDRSNIIADRNNALIERKRKDSE
ncbi:DUF309 domain-containing protein [Bacillus sp. CGMCC 1.16607]|uniref:DUF309 domain-containing protein n=1 Tax=Bacillus sp. CGMCC 1.16607 TaxID=3351842 RepID=UPI0036267D76